MKIDIYTLLGLVKNGKAPKKIKFKNEICEYESHGFIDYVGIEKETNIKFYLSSHIGNNYISDIFTDEVEIIEEPKKIEKLEPVRGSDLSDLTDKDMVLKNNALIELCKTLNNMNNKINELIDAVNELKRDK